MAVNHQKSRIRGIFTALALGLGTLGAANALSVTPASAQSRMPVQVMNPHQPGIFNPAILNSIQQVAGAASKTGVDINGNMLFRTIVSLRDQMNLTGHDPQDAARQLACTNKMLASILPTIHGYLGNAEISGLLQSRGVDTANIRRDLNEASYVADATQRGLAQKGISAVGCREETPRRRF